MTPEEAARMGGNEIAPAREPEPRRGRILAGIIAIGFAVLTALVALAVGLPHG